MAITLEDEKSARLTEAAQHHDGPVGAASLVRAYYRNVAAEDVCERGPHDLYRALASHLELARVRPQGTAKVRVVTPGDGEGRSRRGSRRPGGGIPGSTGAARGAILGGWTTPAWAWSAHHPFP